MSTNRLVAQWLIGIALAVLLAWGIPATQSRSNYWRQAEALRSDSLSAARQADSVRRVNGDTVAAYVFVPPGPLGRGTSSASQYNRTRNFGLAVIALSLLWNTSAWWRGRGGDPGDAAT